MSSSEATARASASPQPGASLAGLIGVLDRADAARARPVHTSASRSSLRAVPLRSVQRAPAPRGPAPSVRRTPIVTVVPEPERRPITGVRDLTRRLALWGGGPRGEYLAWRTPEPAPRARLRPRLRALTRRIALWGAGPDGEHLAWGRPAPLPVREVDPPVVLRELPSTPTIRPAAPSPAVALISAPIGPVGPTWAAPPPGWPRPPAWHTSRRDVPAAGQTAVAPAVPAPRRTVPAARSPSAGARAGPARARGDPTCRPAPRPALPVPG